MTYSIKALNTETQEWETIPAYFGDSDEQTTSTRSNAEAEEAVAELKTIKQTTYKHVQVTKNIEYSDFPH